MNANFIRKPSNKNELLPTDEFVIEKVVEIDNVIFEIFLNNCLIIMILLKIILI